MRNHLLFTSLPLFIILTAFTPLAIASERENNAGLSDAGKRRIEQNILILDQNIKDSQTNVELTKKNITTLENEITTLNTLEKEYLALKQKYEIYAVEASKEIDKNTAALKELGKFRGANTTTGATAPSAETSEQLTRAKNEENERTQWKAEAEAKLDKANHQLSEVNGSLANIESRRGPIQKQLQSNSNKQKEYEDLISKTALKKTQMEKTVQK